MLGCLGGLLGDSYALLSLGLLGVVVVILNIQALRLAQNAKLATSLAILVCGFAGVLCGAGHTLTPTAVAVLSAALLAWKKAMAGFSIGLTETELRSAILLAILAFVIYPALPTGFIDRWNLIEPRAAWVTVILIAAIGFANYILLKLYGAKGIELTGFLGGFVNSTVTVAELAHRVRDSPSLSPTAYRGVMLATAAMLVRNALLLAIIAPSALPSSFPALLLMLAASIGLAFLHGRTSTGDGITAESLPLTSPFSLPSTLKFGAIFLALQVGGTIAQQLLGRFGFYAISLIGGLISSASAVGSAGSLASNDVVSANAAGIATALASVTSALVNLPVVARVCSNTILPRQLAVGLLIITFLGIIGIVIGAAIPAEAIKQFNDLITHLKHR